MIDGTTIFIVVALALGTSVYCLGQEERPTVVGGIFKCLGLFVLMIAAGVVFYKP